METIKVSTEHPKYIKMSPIWRQMDDVIKGSHAVKAKGTEFLPMLRSDQDKSEYNDYKDRAQWFAATGQAKKAYMGMLFSKEPQVNLPASMDVFKEDPTRDSKDFNTVIFSITEEVVKFDKVGILVDMPERAPGLTQAQAELPENQPYWSKYGAESIIN